MAAEKWLNLRSGAVVTPDMLKDHILDIFDKIEEKIPGIAPYLAKEDPPIDLMDEAYTKWFRKEPKGRTKSGKPIYKYRPMGAVHKQELKSIHQKIHRFLEPVASKHVYSYTPKTAPRDCAALHVGRFAVFGLDIKGFFPSITRSMIEQVYLEHIDLINRRYKLGFGKARIARYARILGIICSVKDMEGNNTIEAVLPIGIEPSTSISNAIPYKLDEKLYRLCSKRGYVYTRFSDNIFISSDSEHIPREFQEDVKSIVEQFEYAGKRPFLINAKKTRYSPYWRQQRILGIVVNEKVNITQGKERWTRSALNHLYWDSKRLLESAESGTLLREAAKREYSKLYATSQKVFGNVSYFTSVNRDKGMKYHTQQLAIKVNLRRVRAMIGSGEIKSRRAKKAKEDGNDNK